MIRRFFRVTLAAAVLAVSALPALAAERPLTPDDVLRLEDLGQVVLSPDGEWLAYTVKRPKTVSFHKWDYLNGDDRSDVWLVPSSGGTPRRVTDGVTDGAGFWMPTWSPDGSRIAMLSSRGDNVYLWVWDRATGGLRKLTERAVDTIALGERGPAWISSRELFCPVMPEGERPLMMAVEIQVAEKAPRAWERAARGDAVTASVLETGTAQDFSKRPVQELLRIDATNGSSKAVATAVAFNDLRLAPGSRTLAYLGQNGVMNPDPGSLLEPRNHWVFGAATLPTGGGTPAAGGRNRRRPERIPGLVPRRLAVRRGRARAEAHVGKAARVHVPGRGSVRGRLRRRDRSDTGHVRHGEAAMVVAQRARGRGANAQAGEAGAQGTSGLVAPREGRAAA